MSVNPDPRDVPAVADPHRRLLLRGGYVITMDPALGDLVGDVLVVGDRIEAVSPHLGDVGDALVVDVTGAAVIPGFVDSHVHAWEGALRGVAPDADFMEYMALAHRTFAPLMQPEDVSAGERLTIAQAIENGVTTIVDNSHISRSPEHSDAAIDALVSAGIRAVHAVGAPGLGAVPAHLPHAVVELRDRWATAADGLITVRQFDITPTIAKWRFAAENDLGVVAELSSAVPELDELLGSALVGPRHTFNHCSGLSSEQWKRISGSGAAVNVVPRSDSHFGLGGFVPILEANRHGVQEGISTDNELSYGYDMFTEMRVLQTVQRGLAFQERYAGREDAPALYGARDVLRAATVGGALNAGLSDRIGTLTPGKQADITVLGLDRVPTRHFGSVIGAVVNFASSADVHTVLINGVARKWAGRLVGTDFPALVSAAESSRERLFARTGTSLETVRLATNLRFE